MSLEQLCIGYIIENKTNIPINRRHLPYPVVDKLVYWGYKFDKVHEKYNQLIGYTDKIN